MHWLFGSVLTYWVWVMWFNTLLSHCQNWALNGRWPAKLHIYQALLQQHRIELTISDSGRIHCGIIQPDSTVQKPRLCSVWAKLMMKKKWSAVHSRLMPSRQSDHYLGYNTGHRYDEGVTVDLTALYVDCSRYIITVYILYISKLNSSYY